ncbi:MAG: translocation/assembly module TamB domain-containing protein [Prevotella sp.]|nr:translocation/assembly module TamB domain-containing protein [Prevotella sp.]
MKKVLKWAGVALLIPFLIVAMLSLLLYFPPFQRWATDKAAIIVSEQTGLNVSVGEVSLHFPLELSMGDVVAVRMREIQPPPVDTVANVRNLALKIQLLPLFSGRINVDKLELTDVKLNTLDLVDAAQVQGTAGQISVQSHGIDLERKYVNLDDVKLANADVLVALTGKETEDTTASPSSWQIYLEKLKIDHSVIALHTPADSVQLGASIESLSAKRGFFDLEKGKYSVASVNWEDGQFSCHKIYEPSVGGIDYNHLDFKNIYINVDSIEYASSKFHAQLRSASLKEQGGLTIEQMSGTVNMIENNLKVEDLHVKTPDSSLSTQLNIDLDSFSDNPGGAVNAQIHVILGRDDIEHFAPGLPASLWKAWPDVPLTIDGTVGGSMEHLSIHQMTLHLPSAFYLTASGTIKNLNKTDQMAADIDVHATTHHLNFLTSVLSPDLRRQVRIPSGIVLDGNIMAEHRLYGANLTVRQGGGTARLNGKVDMGTLAYNAHLITQEFPLKNFLPHQSVTPLSITVNAQGKGTDFLSTSTVFSAQVDVASLGYDSYLLNGLRAEAKVENGVIDVQAKADNRQMKGTAHLAALSGKKNLRGTLSFDIRELDLHDMQLADSVFTVGGCGHVDIASDFSQYYEAKGQIDDLVLKGQYDTYLPDDVFFSVMTRPDTTWAKVDTGDFHLSANASGGYNVLLTQVDTLFSEGKRQWKAKKIDQTMLRERFPDGHIVLYAGRNNFVNQMLVHAGYDYGRMNIDLATSHSDGIEGFLHVDSLIASGIRIDTIRIKLHSELDIIKYYAQVRNGKGNPQYVFNALVDGSLTENGSGLVANIYDANGDLGIGMGLAATLEEEGVRFSLTDDQSVLGFKRFHANNGNYVYLADDRRISADVVLKASDGTGVQIYTNDDNEDALQDVTIALNQFELSQIFSAIPYIPSIQGILDGDFHFVQTEEDVSVSTNLAVNQFIYEQNPLGNLGTEFVYMPKSDGSHYVDGILLRDSREIGTLSGTYSADAGFDAVIGLQRAPLSMLNGFIPDRIVGLRGYGEGDLTLKGTLDKPIIDGEIYLDSSSIYSEPYGVEMRFADDPVRIEHSRLLFENFEMFANNDSPLNVSGYYDFSNLDRMLMNIRMKAQNFMLIDAKENPRSEAFGKAYVNFFGSMSGPVDNLSMAGKLDVLGTTDLTYILRDSELSNDTQLEELVKFTDFKDTTTVVQVSKPPLTGFMMNLVVGIDEAAHVFCALNTDKTNYLDIYGGGELRMKYNPSDALTLTGRYTLDSGKMKYSLPVIPLKTFSIERGSYVEFTGDATNPTLNITATENVKATVGDGTGRPVDFTCGVKLSQTLNNLGLSFVIDAPSDMAVRDELNTMGTEERGKVAITMLASGMYLADGNTSGFTMNSALSSFLQTEINNIAGSAMRSMGLDIGMSIDNSTNASGDMHTDYNFQFAKRLWNNRLSFIVGGKVSTGSEVQTRDDSFFDNVELEYRLNQNASQYLRMFYDNNTYDWLEGMIGQYGVGFMWKRKLQHFRDIFRLKGETNSLPGDAVRKEKPMPTDTISVKAIGERRTDEE